MLIDELRHLTYDLDWNEQVVFDSISAVLASANQNPDFLNTGLISSTQVRDIFKVSTCLGFTILQHFGAVERLHEATDWQSKHPDTWRLIRQGQRTVGLGTTHLAKAGEVTLAATKTSDGNHVVNGTVPWISGVGHFDHFVLGFECEANTVVAILPRPAIERHSRFSQYKLACLNGTGTGALEVADLPVPSDLVLSVTPTGAPTRKTGTRYINPELGIAERALEAVEVKLQKSSKNPRLSEASTSLAALRKQIADIDRLASDTTVDRVQMCFQRDDLIHKCIRFLTIVEGGFALSADSISSLLWSQVRLLDVFIQPPALLNMKMSKLGT